MINEIKNLNSNTLGKEIHMKNKNIKNENIKKEKQFSKNKSKEFKDHSDNNNPNWDKTNHTQFKKSRIKENEVKLKALEYFNLGFNVIPICYKSKVPALGNWKNFQTKKVTIEQINKWFAIENINIGIITGSISNLVVVDVDNKQILDDLLKELPETWICKTGRGYHFYFLLDEGYVVNTRKLTNLGIDIKGEGGYVLAPPSTHPSGSVYEWIVFKDTIEKPAYFSQFLESLKKIIHIKSTELDIKVDFETLLNNNLQSKKEPKTSEVNFAVKEIEIVDKKQSLYNFYDKIIKSEINSEKLTEYYAGVEIGKRNVSLTRIAGSLFLDGLNEEEVLSLLLAVNERNRPPLPEKEVKTIVKSLSRRIKQVKPKEEKIYALVDSLFEKEKQINALEFVRNIVNIMEMKGNYRDDYISLVLGFRAVVKRLVKHLGLEKE